MSGYDYGEFLARVRAHQLHVRGRTGPTGCWVCDVLQAGRVRTQARCERISGGVVDAHHAGVPKQVLKRELSRGVVEVRLPGGGHGWRPDPPLPPYRPEAHVMPAPRRSLDDLLMDPRNGILVRRYHHDLLEARALAIPVALLPPDVLEFADELGLRWWLDNQEARRA